MTDVPLEKVPGIGPATARALATRGIASAEDLGAASIEEIAAVPGFGPTRAAVTRQAARQLVARAATVESTDQEPGGKKKKKKRKKKKKKKKKKKQK